MEGKGISLAQFSFQTFSIITNHSCTLHQYTEKEYTHQKHSEHMKIHIRFSRWLEHSIVILEITGFTLQLYESEIVCTCKGFCVSTSLPKEPCHSLLTQSLTFLMPPFQSPPLPLYPRHSSPSRPPSPLLPRHPHCPLINPSPSPLSPQHAHLQPPFPAPSRPPQA